MSEMAEKVLHPYLSLENIEALNAWIKKYPADQKQSAVLEGLRLLQETQGYLTEGAMDALAEYLGMPPISVYEVASFYSMMKTKPTGRHCIDVCTNISCMLRGSAEVVRYLEDNLNIKMGETTADGRFTLRSVECLGACINAPMMMIDQTYYENLDNEKINEALELHP